MLRTAVSTLVLMVATLPAMAADWDEWADADMSFRGSQWVEPKDWTEMGDGTDSLGFEFGMRYWYSLGSQDFETGAGAITSEDAAHIGELHLRIDDARTNTFAKGFAGYSAAINGTSSSPQFGTNSYADGHVGYAGADFGWHAFRSPDGSGSGPMIGYLYWREAPNTGRFSYTTATAGNVTFDPDSGQTFLPGDSSPNQLDINALRLGYQTRVHLGQQIDFTGEIAAVPYAKVSGTMGGAGVQFDDSVYAGPAQPPFEGAFGNISQAISSPANVDGWAYGAMAEGFVGFHPAENLTFRLGGRAWYLTGSADRTYTVTNVGNPTDSDPDDSTNFDTGPTVAQTGVIETSNPFSLFRYGLLAELTYRF
ncbi:MAG: hypothetical protein ACO1OK_09390 [Devosia sp.]